MSYKAIKSNIIYFKIKVDSYDSLPIEKRMTLHNVIILIKSVLNRNKNNYYYKIFLEKCSFLLAKKINTNFFHSMIMLRFGEKEIKREKFYA